MKNAKSLVGHLAVITGASSGIGKEYAHQLAALGVDLILAARREDRLHALAHELQQKYQIQAFIIPIDLSQPHASQSLFEKAVALGHPITMLINNAGVGKYGNFMDFSYADHHATIQINSIVPTELTYRFVEHMLSHGKPSYITQVASIAAFQPVGYFTVYSGTKGYLRYFSETLAFELRSTNIHVMCLCPGGTYTEFFEQSGQKITSAGQSAMMSAKTVVQSGIESMLSRKTVCVPGILNKLACFIPRLLPRRLALHLAFLTMNRSVEKAQIPIK
jgi:short-subunit dehydrogenase